MRALIFHSSRLVAALVRLLTVACFRRRVDALPEVCLAAARAYSSRRLTLAINLGLSMIEQTDAGVYYVDRVVCTNGAALSWMVCLAVAPVAGHHSASAADLWRSGVTKEAPQRRCSSRLAMTISTALVLLMTQVVMFLISLLPGAIVLATNGRPLANRASA